MKYIVTSAQMKKTEENADRKGITPSTLMENAGAACYKQLVKLLGDVNGLAFVVLCGRGNNGGDGIVLAQKLKENGGLVLCVFVTDLPNSATAREKYSKYCVIGGSEGSALDNTLYTHREDTVKKAITNCDAVIDCVFGTGFEGELEPRLSSLFRFVNTSFEGLKVSVDVPSGINASTGEYAERAFRPDVTFMLGGAKKGLYSHPAFEACGDLVLLDIGIPDDCFSEYEAAFIDEDVLRHIPVRKKSSHKGDYGRLLNIAGSEQYIGAALLSTKAALKCGAGIVTLASVRSVCRSIAPAVPEATYLPLYADADGFADGESTETVKSKLGAFNTIALGCGLGITANTQNLTEFVLKNCSQPVILDADGINLLSLNINILKENDRIKVITPHPMEFSRLTGVSVTEIQADRIRHAREFSAARNAVTVLKGINTVIAAPDGRAFVNITGNPGLAKGGSGDVLTGMIASFTAQGVRPLEASMLGVYLHGLTADELAKSTALSGIMPGDIAEILPVVMKSLQ
ncbi:MAG: NAD(P)H-hydrate dehydratase [Oscillospiraceae bacterium]|jgi:NAD(P)H-hydrate epimerase|nr:NAD(P)H-hydrate dehydratase [Oscillospiraceae bacterium]